MGIDVGIDGIDFDGAFCAAKDIQSFGIALWLASIEALWHCQTSQRLQHAIYRPVRTEMLGKG